MGLNEDLGDRENIGSAAVAAQRTRDKANEQIAAMINSLTRHVHAANKQWWRNLETDEPIQRNVGELLALVHSEISEALEGHRKNLMDDKLPHRKMFEVELADAIIRIFDIAAGLNLDLGGAYVEKMAFNAQREDHKRESRLLANGKKY
jgi:NTP pyrophosphatase (non-canonical NTP hydrolase)